MGTPFPLARLGDDILVLSFAYLPINDLAALACVSKRFDRLATCNYLWNEKIRQRSLVLTPSVADSIPKSNLEDFSGILRRNRKWCSPAVLGLSESELQSVHLQLVAVAAAVDAASPSLRFRGKRYAVVGRTYARWWRRYIPHLVCNTKDFIFELVKDHNEVHSADTPVTYAKLARGGSAKRDIYYPHIAACIGGMVLHVPPPPPPLAPAPEACAEPGYYKFLYRHALVELRELCYMCAKNMRCVCLGRLQLVCGRCWRENDLDLFMSTDQAREEFFMEEADLHGTADWCTKDTKMRRAWAPPTPKRRRSAPESAPPAPAPSAQLSARFYREFQVAYFAVLKWGSTVAIERKRAQRAAALGQQATGAKLAADILMLASFPASDVEMTERGKRKRATGKEDADYRDERRDTPAGSPPAPVSAEERRPARRSKRTAALKRKSYVYDDLDVIAESALTDVFRWGVKL